MNLWLIIYLSSQIHDLRETQKNIFGMVDRHGAELTLSSRNAMFEHAEAIASI